MQIGGWRPKGKNVVKRDYCQLLGEGRITSLHGRKMDGIHLLLYVSSCAVQSYGSGDVMLNTPNNMSSHCFSNGKRTRAGFSCQAYIMLVDHVEVQALSEKEVGGL